MEVQWLALITTNVQEMPFVQVDLVFALNPMLAPIVKILVTLQPAFPMHNALFKTRSQCADVCLVTNFCQCKGLALTLMNAVLQLPLVVLEPFAKTPLDHSGVNAQRGHLEIHPELA